MYYDAGRWNREMDLIDNHLRVRFAPELAFIVIRLCPLLLDPAGEEMWLLTGTQSALTPVMAAAAFSPSALRRGVQQAIEDRQRLEGPSSLPPLREPHQLLATQQRRGALQREMQSLRNAAERSQTDEATQRARDLYLQRQLEWNDIENQLHDDEVRGRFEFRCAEADAQIDRARRALELGISYWQQAVRDEAEFPFTFVTLPDTDDQRGLSAWIDCVCQQAALDVEAAQHSSQQDL